MTAHADPEDAGPERAAAPPPAQPPPCPITGEPATRLIQTVSAGLLTGLWRHSARVDVGPLLRPKGPFGLWESPAGLAFFHPAVEGDARFYRAFYDRLRLHDRIAGAAAVRNEFVLAAGHVPDGARVLDVGCGEGAFRRHVPRADYTGLDPHFAADVPDGAVLAETVGRHAERAGGSYDVVCAFQVLEHTADPLGFARDMARCLRPGGTLLVGVPTWPSVVTRIPNFVVSAPPHHLTWWNEPSLRALAGALGLVPERVHTVPMSAFEALVHWMDLVNPVKSRGRYFQARWQAYAALAWSYAVGSLLARLLPLPRAAGSNIMLLAARKPG